MIHLVHDFVKNKYKKCIVLNYIFNRRELYNRRIGFHSIIRDIDYINCDSAIFSVPIIKRIMWGFHIICNEIRLYANDEYPGMRNMTPLKYGIIISSNNENQIKGACDSRDRDLCQHRVYINPNSVNIIPCDNLFTSIFSIAKHEMTHAILNTYNNAQHLQHEHGEEFVTVMDEIECHFYDKDSLRKKSLLCNNF